MHTCRVFQAPEDACLGLGSVWRGVGALGAVPCLLVAIIPLVLSLTPPSPGVLSRAMHMRHTAWQHDVMTMVGSYKGMKHKMPARICLL